MIQKKEEWINFTKRILSNESISIKIYIVWGILTLLLFGFMGFIPVSKIFITNTNILEDLYQNNLKLEKKIVELEEAKQKVDIVGDDIHILDKFLPDEFRAQNYLVEMSDIFGKYGFYTDSVNFRNTDSHKIGMDVKISGKGDLKDIVKNLEESKKLYEVQRIDLNVGDREDIVNINVVSFIMEGK